MMPDLPKCLACGEGVLLPLSDYGEEGASVLFKAWACSAAPKCKFQLRVDKGTVTYAQTEEYHKRNHSGR